MQLRQLSLPQSSSHHLNIYPFASLQEIPDNKLPYNINFGASNSSNMAGSSMAYNYGSSQHGRHSSGKKGSGKGNGGKGEAKEEYYEWKWACCQCGHAAMDTEATPACPECGYVRCENCPMEAVKRYRTRR